MTYATTTVTWIIDPDEFNTPVPVMPTLPKTGLFTLEWGKDSSEIIVHSPTPLHQQSAWVLLACMTDLVWTGSTLRFSNIEAMSSGIRAFVSGPFTAMEVIRDWWMDGMLSHRDLRIMTEWLEDYADSGDGSPESPESFALFCLLMAETVDEDWTPEPWRVRVQTRIRQMIDTYLTHQMSSVIALTREMTTWK